ncbi:hypothetical protein VTN02DRAFT_6725 [Thermoascus thermophilus]
MMFILHLLLALLLAPIEGPTPAAALDVAYCSPLNTGSSFKADVSTFQSNGLCHDTCNADYAFAVLQGNSCWCTNYAPGQTTDVSNCADGCPGYPSDNCGSVSKDLFAYIEMTNHAPSGTIGSTATQTTTSSSVTSVSSVSTTLTTAPTKPTLSVQTVAGQPVTITVKNPGATASSTPPPTSHHGSSLSGGAIAGIVIGALAGAGILLGLLFWFCFVRRRYANPDAPDLHNHTLLDGRRHSKGSQMSLMRNLYDHGSSPGGPGSSSPIDHPVPAFTDSRMKKDAVLYPNGNHHSTISLQDNQDYSRPILRLTNPDP